jgi:hypothetical protein
VEQLAVIVEPQPLSPEELGQLRHLSGVRTTISIAHFKRQEHVLINHSRKGSNNVIYLLGTNKSIFQNLPFTYLPKSVVKSNPL